MSRPMQAALGATILWGLAVLYWKLLAGVAPMVVLSHRTVWALVFFGLWLGWQGRIGEVFRLITGPQRLRVLAATVLVALNWFTYIWAVGAGHTVQASFGYYIYPLVTVLLGVLVYRERPGGAQVVAIGLAALAVAVLGLGLGVTPWIALVLALSFAGYGLMKKGLDAGPILSVTAEVLLAAPVVVGLALWQGDRFWGDSLFTNALLVGAGPVTSVPLILYAYGMRRLPMGTSGVLFYINPTLQFLVAAVIFGEPVTRWHWLAFPLIWAAVAIYSGDMLRQDRAARKRSAMAGTSSTTSMKPMSEGSAKP